jgi:elongation factor P--(R)-beta-lysine ligase
MDIKTKIDNLPNYHVYVSLVRSIENFLTDNGFLKLELPTLLPYLIPESYLEVFETEYRFFDKRKKMYLAPSPESLIKRLLVDGIGDCYYLGKSYRNSEPPSSRHSGEFTMLEFYKINTDYMEIAETVIQMLRSIYESVSRITNKKEIVFRNSKISFEKWEKLTVAEAFEQYANMSNGVVFDKEKFVYLARKKGYQTENNGQNFSYEELWSQIYANEVEPNLGTNGYPTLIYNYPTAFAPLSKPNEDGLTSKRFEFYISGLELGNCYGELTDWKLQAERLQIEQEDRRKYSKIAIEQDDGFITALKRGMPECSGIAIGVDRLAMVFANVGHIGDISLVSVDQSS